MRRWAVEGLPFDTLEQVSVPEAVRRVRAGEARLLDVRQPKEWKDGHASGALHIPGALLPEAVARVSHDASWIVACSTGYRSTIAASVLRRAGVRDVANLLGGMSAWAAAEFPLER
jgi:hydroxyacylglutathione hydrolase